MRRKLLDPSVRYCNAKCCGTKKNEINKHKTSNGQDQATGENGRVRHPTRGKPH